MTIKTVSSFGDRPLRLPPVLSRPEQLALLAAPNRHCPTGLRNYCMLCIYLNLGLRVREAINLTTADVCWETGKVFVIKGKGGRDRVLWLSTEDLDNLKLWREKLTTNTKSDYLFCTLAGGKISDRYVRDFVKRYAARAAISQYKRVHPHMLRHSFATDLLKRTQNIRIVQKALGHVSLQNTMIYTHIVDDVLEEALRHFREEADAT